MYDTVLQYNVELSHNILSQIQKMQEIQIATQLISQYLAPYYEEERLNRFRETLVDAMVQKYSNSWEVDNPLRGNAFRAINVIDNRLDSLLIRTAQLSGVHLSPTFFPKSIVIWIDPRSVSYRIGDYGNTIYIYDGRKPVRTSSSLASPPSSPPGY